jgi:RHH-type proline utilization regulon transcriptional repressor/proline dehydrogenase/delta 1-pyrroline-5-carboxylate dehydrogenase
LVFDIAPEAATAQEELFGPVLCVFRAPSFDDALALAAASPYALTASLYSRCPSHIASARARWRVGNLYINRPSTGALVWRQPFGGSARSGVGSKAGGPDYLIQFLEPKVTAENTTRRGFAPLTQPLNP